MHPVDIITPAQIHGHVRVMVVDQQTREVLRVVENSNLVTFEGADVMSRIVAGNVTVPINMMYIEFGNSSPAIPTATRVGGRSYYDALADESSDFLRVPMISGPVLAASSSSYNSNKTTFTAISNATTGYNSTPFSDTSSSEVVGAALVVAPSLTDQTQDYVFSRYYLSSTVAKASGQEIVIQWSLVFE
jgi:hypothetical protein